MAIVTATYNTETKELSLNIDGVDKGPAQSITMYSHVEKEGDETERYGYFSADFAKSKDNGVKYCMSAQGSKVNTDEDIVEYIKKSLSQK